MTLFLFFAQAMASVADLPHSQCSYLASFQESCMPKQLGGADIPRKCVFVSKLGRGEDDLRLLSKCTCIDTVTELINALMWIPGASTQHITSAKLVKVPVHP